MNLKLTVFELTEEQEEAQEDGLQLRLEDCDTAEITFWNIANVKPVGQYCIISSDGSFYTVNESAESVNKKIEERKAFLFN